MLLFTRLDRPIPKLLLLFVLTLVSVATVSFPIWENGDIAIKWLVAKAWASFEFPPFSPVHHVLRWGINVPASAFIFLFGDSPRSYLALNYLVFSLATVLLFRLVWFTTTLWVALVILAIWLLNPFVYLVASNLMPELYQIFYLIVALTVLRSAYVRNSRVLYALGIVVLFFMYGAKETDVFFMPGLAIYELVRRQYVNFIIMAAVYSGLLLVETAVIDLIFRSDGILLGRIELLLTGIHASGMRTHAHFGDYTPIDMFRRWWFLGAAKFERLEYYSKVLYFMFFGLSLCYLIVRRRATTSRLSEESRDTAIERLLQTTIAAGLSFAVCVTFFVISLRPFTLGLTLEDRYLWVLLVPTLLVLAHFLYTLRAFLPRLPLSWIDTSRARVARWLKGHPGLHRRAFVIVVTGIIVASTMERFAIDYAFTQIRRVGAARAYWFPQANAYYDSSIREHLEAGCTLIFATKRTAWSAMVFGLPFGYFTDASGALPLNLDGVRTNSGATLRGWKPDVEDWEGLRHKLHVYPTRRRDGREVWELYALRLEGGSTRDCDGSKGYYLGQLDLHPRDQAVTLKGSR